MRKIQVLDQTTIDQIAAGEVIERPASVVKELVENAIDAGATSVTIDIKEGGISFIRVADNGCGIPKEEVPSAFLRHATSKISTVDDLNATTSLGFRGEALSSIAAVSQVELITKTKDNPFGTLYRISGGREEGAPREAGAPDGTTFLVRQLFYNTPARRKFLKTAMTEASHVSDFVSRLALSRPDISFTFINNGQTRLHTSGNGKLLDVIYQIYGKEVTDHLFPVDFSKEGIQIGGYLGLPLISRGNRNQETYFVNQRYMKNPTISKALEDAYKDFTMQHKYPFVVLSIDLDPGQVDVNVHPTKMEVKFLNSQQIYNAVYEAVDRGLHADEQIPKVELAVEKEMDPHLSQPAAQTADQDESPLPPKEKRDEAYFMEEMRKRVTAYHENLHTQQEETEQKPAQEPMVREEQLDLFQEHILSGNAAPDYKLIGQAFDTYWLVQYQDQLYIIDQHAAHERVLYERTLQEMENRTFTSQMIEPPMILQLSMQEEETLKDSLATFQKIGFEIEAFGNASYAVRAVPDNLFGLAKKELFLEMLDDLSDEVKRRQAPQLLDEKIASMACKAAVKGNMHLSAQEVDALIGELLTLDNPYHCPHGRPTMIVLTKRDLEKNFKRIV